MGLFKKKSETVITTAKGVYLSGLPNYFVTKGVFYLILDEEEGFLRFKKSLEDTESINLALSKITSLETITEEKIVKEKNGVGRAVAGGLLCGPAGAVVGAVTAKDKKAKVCYQSLDYVSNEEEKSITFQNGDLNCIKFCNHLREIIQKSKPQITTVEL